MQKILDWLSDTSDATIARSEAELEKLCTERGWLWHVYKKDGGFQCGIVRREEGRYLGVLEAFGVSPSQARERAVALERGRTDD